MRTPFAVIAVLFVVLLGISIVTGNEDEAPAHSAPPAHASVAVVARRVEALRDLRFTALPKPVPVSAATARREGLAELDTDYPAAQRRADETIYKLLGLIAPSDDLRTLTGTLFEQGVLGYYDPRDGRLRVVTGAGTEHARAVGDDTRARADARAGGPAVLAPGLQRRQRRPLFGTNGADRGYGYLDDVRLRPAPLQQRGDAGRAYSARRSRTRATSRRSSRRR